MTAHSIDSAKVVLYAGAIACFAVAGVLDLIGGSRKLGVVAPVFALANGLIFFWRE